MFNGKFGFSTIKCVKHQGTSITQVHFRGRWSHWWHCLLSVNTWSPCYPLRGQSLLITNRVLGKKTSWAPERHSFTLRMHFFLLRTATQLELVHFPLHKYCKQSSKWVVKHVIQLCTVHFSGKYCTSILPKPPLLYSLPNLLACDTWTASHLSLLRCMLLADFQSYNQALSPSLSLSLFLTWCGASVWWSCAKLAS